MSPTDEQREQEELRRLRHQIDDLTATLNAIRCGDVDALVQVEGGALQLYSRTSADRPYRLIVEEMGEGAATLSPLGRILFANQRLADLIHADHAALLDAPVAELVTPECRQDLDTLLAVTPGHTLRLPLDLQGADGGTVPVLASVSVVEIEGEPVRCLIAADLTRVREAEQALMESELSFRMLALNSQDGILLVEWESGRITLANPYICELLARDVNELIGSPIWEINAFDDRQRAQALFLELKATGTVRYDDLPLLDASGGLKEVEFVSNVYLVGEQQLIQCNIRDISDRREAERLAQQRQAEVLRSLQDMVSALVSLSEARDPYTAGHQSRVADLAAAIGGELGLDDEEVEGLRISGLVHDIGKFSIPSEILTKPSALKPQELELLRTHVQEGYAVLAPIHFPWPVADAVLQHHERLDGSGYPQGLQGEAIGLEDRILAVADAVEAMATHRPYRFAIGIEAALETIQAGQGRLFDPAVVEACLRLFHGRGYALVSPGDELRP